MQENSRQNSIVSYAGTPKATLLSLAKQAFAQADFHVPERFATFVPLFPFELIQNMDYLGKGEGNAAPVSPTGFSIDPREYHHKLYLQLPDLYVSDNYSRNFDYEGHFIGRSVFTVDQAWATRFPQYSPFLGEKLMLHMIGGGHQAVAVPESVFPKGQGVLQAVERDMQVTQRVQQFLQYVRGRLSAGEKYQAEVFGEEYLSLTGLEPVMLRQSELGRVMQDLSIARSMQTDTPATSLFTESAKRVENLRQYVPYQYACDTFEAEAVTRHTARLFQPCFQGNEFVSDLWMPYQDLAGYVDRDAMAVDMGRLCQGFQLAPVYDPETGGGRYPDAIRVVQVRDRETQTMGGDVLNNPAYGGGMNPSGMIARQVFVEGSQELLRQRKLVLERVELAVMNREVSPEDYRRCLSLAALQEAKGKLIDTMYSREAALSQMEESSPQYKKTKARLDEKVATAGVRVEKFSAAWKHGQVSGYDADIDYLRRKQLSREGLPEEEGREPVDFTLDPHREQSIESGYAMRNNVRRMTYEEAYKPPEKPTPAPVVQAAKEAKAPQEKGPTTKVQAEIKGASPTPQEAKPQETKTRESAPSKEQAPPNKQTPSRDSLQEAEQEGPITDPTSEVPKSPAADPPAAATAPSSEDLYSAYKRPKADIPTPKDPLESKTDTSAPEDPPESKEPPTNFNKPQSPSKAPHTPLSLEEVAGKAAEPAPPPKLAYIAHRDSQREAPPVIAINKDGKMASLLHPRPGKAPASPTPPPKEKEEPLSPAKAPANNPPKASPSHKKGETPPKE